MKSFLASNASRAFRLGQHSRAAGQAFASKGVIRSPSAQLGGSKTRRTGPAAGGGSGGNKIGNGGGRGGGGDGSAGGSSGGGLWGAYLSALEKNPVVIKSATSAVLNAAGDVLSQLFFEEGEKFNWKRTLTFAFVGLALVGPALHFWYGALAKVISQQGTQGALMRLAADQFAFAPAFIAVIFSSLLVLEGRPGDIQAKLKQDWKGAMYANWKLWIPFQFINFRFVPQHLQVLAANVVSVGWNTYLSWASHRTLVVEEV